MTSKLLTCPTGNWTVLYLFKKMLSAITFKEAYTDSFSEARNGQTLKKKLLKEERPLIYDNACTLL